MDLKRRIVAKICDASVRYDPSIPLIHLMGCSSEHTPQSKAREFESWVYVGKKYGLNYKRKVHFEYSYMKMKYRIYKALGKAQSIPIRKTIKYLEENCAKLISGNI